MTSSAFSLEGKVALVTGSAKGIGQAIATALADAGADVACHGRGESPTESVKLITDRGRKSLATQADLGKRSDQDALVDQVIAEFGRIDILVNNAGTIRRSPAAEYSDKDWDEIIEINLTSVFRLSRKVGKHMLKRGSGKIINIASLLSFQGGIRVPAYAASKAGVAALTKALANEWAGSGVNVNAIAPGYIRTANTQALQDDKDRNRQLMDRIPAGDWGMPEDIAQPCVFLASDASKYVHGHILAVDGGWMGR